MDTLLNIKKHTDLRGALLYQNHFKLSMFKRCYHITHHKTDVVRAWQGHKNECKAFWITKGSFLIHYAVIKSFENPDINLKFNKIILKFNSPKILIIPGGYVNGFQALEVDSSMMIYSDMTVEKSKLDDFRWDKSFFLNAQWK